MLLRALCEENGVAVRCVNGQMPEGEFGDVMEFLSAWSKEKQVQRAQRGARDGLRDRARIKGLPVNGNAPYGFQIRYELQGDKKVPVCFEPHHTTYPVACRIWGLALAGQSNRRICRTLRTCPTNLLSKPRSEP